MIFKCPDCGGSLQLFGSTNELECDVCKCRFIISISFTKVADGSDRKLLGDGGFPPGNSQ